MDTDEFLSSLLGDAASLANNATAAGGAVIQSDITGYNLTPALLQKADGINIAGNSSLMFLLLLFIVIFVIVREE